MKAAGAIVLAAFAALLLPAPAGASWGDGPFMGFAYRHPTMTLVDRWHGEVPQATLDAYTAATGVRFRVIESKRYLRCDSAHGQMIPQRRLRPGRVILCDRDISDLALGMAIFYLSPDHRSLQRGYIELGAQGTAFCEELGHLFGLGHWLALQPIEPNYCVGGSARCPQAADILRLSAIYQLGMDPRAGQTTRWVLDRLAEQRAAEEAEIEAGTWTPRAAC